MLLLLALFEQSLGLELLFLLHPLPHALLVQLLELLALFLLMALPQLLLGNLLREEGLLVVLLARHLVLDLLHEDLADLHLLPLLQLLQRLLLHAEEVHLPLGEVLGHLRLLAAARNVLLVLRDDVFAFLRVRAAGVRLSGSGA